jgi:rSAM/selenodomain-associated transferase 1
MKPVRIIIFAKAPLPGLAKTRLIPALGAEGAAELARQMLADTLSAAITARVGPVELCVTPPIHDPAWHGFKPGPDVVISDQGDGDLGKRMCGAALRTLQQGQPALLIGTDCAEMSTKLLQQAAAWLANSDAAIHPTLDGGYALLGLTVFDEQLFSGIAWSTDTVAATSIAKMGAAGWRIHIGATLHDVDTPDDLRWLRDGRTTNAER